MKTSSIIFIIIVLCLALGGWYWYFTQSHQPPAVQNEQLANPASVNCTQTLGGQLEIVNETNGQVGYCHLPDGRVCEEWGLFRDKVCTSPQATTATSSAQ